MTILRPTYVSTRQASWQIHVATVKPIALPPRTQWISVQGSSRQHLSHRRQ